MITEKKTRGDLLFLFIVIAIYGITFLFNNQLAIEAFELARKLVYSLVPVLFLVFALIFLSNLLIRPDWIRKHVGKGSGLKGWIIAVISGVLSVGPVYPWYALLKDLKSKGMRTALIAVFLYNRGIKLPLLPLMVHYFGLAFTLVLAVYLTLFSILAGWVMERIVDDDTST